MLHSRCGEPVTRLNSAEPPHSNRLNRERISPAMAMPRPSCNCGFALICDNATSEKIRPSRPNGNPQQQQVTDNNPKMSPACAQEFVLAICPAVEVPRGGGAMT